MPSPAAPTLDDLISRAGPITAERGLQYFAEGLVSNLDIRADSARAQVRGSTRYQVELRGLGEQFDFSCTCPHAIQGNLCKHVVAVGLAWLDALEPERAEAAIDPDQELRTWLNQQPQSVLADLLFDIAMRDDALQRSLRLKLDLGKRSDDPTDNAEAWYQAIDEATEVEDFLDWRQASSFAADLGELADALEQLLTPERAALLIELSEYAIPRVEYALQQIDDSSGELGEVLDRLNQLHLQACALAKPDPIALAERLFDLEMNASFDSFYDSALHYRNVLGNTGLQHFQTLALAEWSQLPRLTAKDQRSNLDSKRSCITRIMATLAKLSGDLEALVAIKARDLSAAYRYLNIAELYQEAGATDMALHWAEQGLAAFPHRTDNRLRDFLAQQYLHCGRTEQALQLTWLQFDEAPSLSSYQKLLGLAQRLHCAPEQRLRALARLASVPGDRSLLLANARSLRLEIALWEEDFEAAWLVSQQGDCPEALLQQLALRLESPRPIDAIGLYRRMLEPIIQQTNNQAYQRAINLIRRMGELMRAQQLDSAFAAELLRLHQRYKAKRNFIKLLDNLLRG
ncbi:SWIM zinc finger domain-containing protein [Pseudomonas sp.]|uniref:SWIM zinc finger family protein n=1 Tax=Pseudomonas sp. TaxID=306 RepID=UPI002736FFDC|nr:DUF6880 family protein [Pseudomonas sp.]MDP3816814.1 hypothetical protein [Pseudomonas sp.]